MYRLSWGITPQTTLRLTRNSSPALLPVKPTGRQVLPRKPWAQSGIVSAQGGDSPVIPQRTENSESDRRRQPIDDSPPFYGFPGDDDFTQSSPNRRSVDDPSTLPTSGGTRPCQEISGCPGSKPDPRSWSWSYKRAHIVGQRLLQNQSWPGDNSTAKIYLSINNVFCWVYLHFVPYLSLKIVCQIKLG